MLENRLQLAEQRFGENISRNRELRSEIESLNKQRETFDQVGAEGDIPPRAREIETFDHLLHVLQGRRIWPPALPYAKILPHCVVLQGRLKLERELHGRRAEVAALQDAAALAGEARAAAASQLEVLKTQVRGRSLDGVRGKGLCKVIKTQMGGGWKELRIWEEVGDVGSVLPQRYALRGH